MKKSILWAILLAASSSSSVVFAGGSSLFGSAPNANSNAAGAMYGGASLGKTSDGGCDANNTLIDNANTLVGSNLLGKRDCSSANAWKVFGGYKVAPNLAIEGSYVNYGKSTENSTVPVIPGINNEPNPVSVTTKATGFGASGVASAPVTDELSLFGKMGAMSWKKESKTMVWNSTKTASMDQTVDSSGVDLSLGAGADYKIDDNWGIRGEYEHLNGLDSNMYSVGATYTTF
jgi:opacity protein-like surface antigen